MSDLDARIRAEWRAWLTEHHPDPTKALERLNAIDASDAARSGQPGENELATARRIQAETALLHDELLAASRPRPRRWFIVDPETGEVLRETTPRP